MKKCRRGKGIRLTASLRRSLFSCPVHGATQSQQALRLADAQDAPAAEKACMLCIGAKMLAALAQEQDCSAVSCPNECAPGKRRQQVTPDMTAEMRWFRSPKEGLVSFRVLKQMSYSASLSRICAQWLP